MLYKIAFWWSLAGLFPLRKFSDPSLLTAPRSISALVPSFIDS
ncbi:hypothetical protein MC28_4998 [Bacillus thuringiensis MC28]|nr:hypothetical protein MC28_4990 [Bacillus thuringiensis MC28]AFU16420.1 hypothetical protein MC28_4998 [Bacillus thuringiensis MC28]